MREMLMDDPLAVKQYFGGQDLTPWEVQVVSWAASGGVGMSTRYTIRYVMVFVRDMARSVAFYRDVVGIPLRFESPQWTEFATDGATLALHVAEEGGPEPADTPAAGGCRSGFEVDDIEAFHARMNEHGVRCVQEPKEVYGARIAQYVDPDGMVFSVSGGRGG